MQLIHIIYISLTLLSASPATSQTCPEDNCSEVNATTYYPKQCDSSSLTMETLDSYVYNGDTLITLLGPSNSTDGAALVIAAPHGGSSKPIYINDRSKNDPAYCPSSGCRTYKDSYTLEIAMATANKVVENYCKVPYIIVNHLHRSKLDTNREINEAAQGDAIAEEAWGKFHDFIFAAQDLVKDTHGEVTGVTGLTGIKGIFFDVHGYSGTDWIPTAGAPFIQWGYRLSEDSLNPESFCPLDTRSSGTIGTFTHARNLEGQSLECLVRGPNSLGSRVADRLSGAASASPYICGAGLPSYEYPNPLELAHDPDYCNDADEDPGDSCHYYSGGYDVNVHENTSSSMMNTVQAEFPRCLRFATYNTRSDVHESIGDVLSVSLCSFMRDLFGEDGNTC